MTKIIAVLVLAMTSQLTAAATPELSRALGKDIRIIADGKVSTIEYCPDNTCEVFTLRGPKATAPLHDFAFAYLFSVSKYIYLKDFQTNAAAPEASAVLRRYRAVCPQHSPTLAARCVVSLLVRRHSIKASFVRYDEGQRNVVPIALAPFRTGT